MTTTTATETRSADAATAGSRLGGAFTFARYSLVSAAVSSILVAGAWGATAPGHIALASHSAPLAATANPSLLPAWCPFGTHDGPGSGCRGGSINDNEDANRAARTTWVRYRDAGKCAFGGVGGAMRDSPKSPGRFAFDSVVGSLSCGVTTYDEHMKTLEKAREGN